MDLDAHVADVLRRLQALEGGNGGSDNAAVDRLAKAVHDLTARVDGIEAEVRKLSHPDRTDAMPGIPDAAVERADSGIG